MGEQVSREDLSLMATPTWAVATVVFVMVFFGSAISSALSHLGKWMRHSKRNSLFAALEKIKEELMLFGVLSLLMGHLTVYVAKICISESAFSSRFYPCAAATDISRLPSDSDHSNSSEELIFARHDYCPKGHESFASYESLEQLHRFLFMLGVTHVAYSFAAIALAMIKIYSWRTWENQAKSMATEGSFSIAAPNKSGFTRLSSFVFHHTSHPWSQNRLLVWLLCFSRQFWSSINQADYMTLRLGFITTHELPLSYDFLNFLLRSIEEEFRDILGISIPQWIYGICCIFFDFHGSNIYFWLSFVPSILILLIGTKLHRIVVKLAFEITDTTPNILQKFNLRDELFWFGKPRLLLRVIQLITFLNAFEMSTFIWSLWEIKEASCFMDNNTFLMARLTFGVVSQFWCSFVTFPLYVIIAQMGSSFKKSVVSKGVRMSLHQWQRRAKYRHSCSTPSLCARSSVSSLVSEMSKPLQNIKGRESPRNNDSLPRHQSTYPAQSRTQLLSRTDTLEDLLNSAPAYDSYDDYSDSEDSEG